MVEIDNGTLVINENNSGTFVAQDKIKLNTQLIKMFKQKSNDDIENESTGDLIEKTIKTTVKNEKFVSVVPLNSKNEINIEFVIMIY